MSIATKKLINDLQHTLSVFDSKYIESQRVWAAERTIAMFEFKRSDEYKSIKNTSERYGRLFDLCGGKTWYNVFYGNSTDAIDAFVIKNCNAIIAKRNAKIAKKLDDAGIVSVGGSDLVLADGGFEGYYEIATDKGNKRVTISIIFAGGYNIQCAHLRVLVKIK